MISVAMASYNGEKYIEQQVLSILSNLSPEDELLVSDDGSTDETVRILIELAEKDTRIHVYQGPGEGIIANFQYVIGLCRGSHIFLADQDDVWQSDKVAKVMAVFRETGCGLVMHDAAVYNEDLTEKMMDSFFAYRGSKAGVFHNIVKNRYMGCCMAFKAELRAYCLPIPKDIQMHDQWIGIVNDMRKEGTILLREPLLLYRRHEDANSDFSHNSMGVMMKNRFVLMRDLLRFKRTIFEGTYREK